MTATRCSKCGASIDFIRTRRGAAVPVDPPCVRGLPFTGKADEGRKWERGYTREGDSLTVYILTPEGEAIPAWMPSRTIQITHFVTCPNAADFTKKKGHRP